MSETGDAWKSPFDRTPGSSTPSPSVGPKEGIGDLWTFFLLAFVNTAIITTVGLVVWWIVNH
jgi:hypothetical protein